VGRTARMGQAGEAILFLLPSEMGYLEWLAEAGCKVAQMNPDLALKALPPPPGKFVSSCSSPFPLSTTMQVSVMTSVKGTLGA